LARRDISNVDNELKSELQERAVGQMTKQIYTERHSSDNNDLDHPYWCTTTIALPPIQTQHLVPWTII
jgi:hypothetical protein